VVAAVDWSPRHRPGVSALVHDRSIVAALRALSVHDPVHVVLVPQLHGLHADRPYLERLAGHLGPQSGPRLSWEVLSDVHDSEVQRRLVAMSDLVVTGRYHPAVFAVAAGIPVICLAYEHKATGVMEAAGLDELVVAVEDVDEATLVGLVERVVADPPRHRVEAAARELRARSVRTAELAAALARPRP
jgi:polysaccharide pyruvyl transferase WcaK-like protein